MVYQSSSYQETKTTRRRRSSKQKQDHAGQGALGKPSSCCCSIKRLKALFGSTDDNQSVENEGYPLRIEADQHRAWSPASKSDAVTTVFVSTLWGALSSGTAVLRSCNGKNVALHSVRGSSSRVNGGCCDKNCSKSRVMMRGESMGDGDNGAPRHMMMRGHGSRKRTASASAVRVTSSAHSDGNHEKRRPSVPKVMMRGRGAGERSQPARVESERKSAPVKSKHHVLADRWRSPHLGRDLSYRSPSPSSVESRVEEDVGLSVDAETDAEPSDGGMPSPLWAATTPVAPARRAKPVGKYAAANGKKRVVPAARRRRFFGSTPNSPSSLTSSLASSSGTLSSDTLSPVVAAVRKVQRSPAWTPSEDFPPESIADIMAQLPADHFLKTPVSPNTRPYALLARKGKGNVVREEVNLGTESPPSAGASLETGSSEEIENTDAIVGVITVPEVAAVSPSPLSSQLDTDDSSKENSLEKMFGVLKESFSPTETTAAAVGRSRREAKRGVWAEGRRGGAVPSSVWVTGYVDRSKMYGLGFLLSDGSIGARFDDGTTMVLDPAGVAFDYIKCAKSERRSVAEESVSSSGVSISSREGPPSQNQRAVHTLDNYPDDLEREVNLLRYFRENLQQLTGKDDVVTSSAVPQESSGQRRSRASLTFVERWRRTRNSCLFLLSNGTVHVVFGDHSEVLLSDDSRRITHVGKDGTRESFRLRTLLRQQRRNDVISKVRLSKSLIAKLLSRA